MSGQEILIRSSRKIWRKWSLVFKILPLVLIVALAKYICHYFGYEVMELNALFTSLVAGTIFLIGFLISGVLSDYKESEKIPSEIAASLKTLYDDTYTILKSKNIESAANFIRYQKELLDSFMQWFYRKESTHSLLNKISGMNDFFVDFENHGVQANYIIKLKNEQNTLRKLILRVNTVRHTDFVISAYTIVEVMGFVIAIGLVIIKIEPFWASLFFTLLVTFLIAYMFFLIKDLDNPFDYAGHGESGTEVSLKPMHELETVMRELSL